jgi:hypothetical protein
MSPGTRKDPRTTALGVSCALLIASAALGCERGGPTALEDTQSVPVMQALDPKGVDRNGDGVICEKTEPPGQEQIAGPYVDNHLRGGQCPRGYRLLSS